MNDKERHDLFSELILQYQSALYAYVFAIVRNWNETDDLYQSVCLVLWRKFDSFQPGTSFFSWARQTAKNEVRNYLRGKKSPASMSEEMLAVLAESAYDSRQDQPELYLSVLNRCKAKLSDLDQKLLDLRYANDLSSREIAARLGRPQQGVCHSLTRVRRWLLRCIQMEIAKEEHSVAYREERS